MGTHRTSIDRVARLVEEHGPGPWTGEELRAAGWSRGQLERAVARGDLVRIRRDLYEHRSARTAEQLALPYDYYRARMRGLARALPGEAAFSHTSAAYVHGMWNPWAPSSVVHATRPGSTGRSDGVLRLHGAALTPEEVTTVDGLRVTTVARTAVDLSRKGDLPAALVVMDSAVRVLMSGDGRALSRRLRDGVVPAAEVHAASARLRDAADAIEGRPGWRTVAAALRVADPRSESPFESWSRGWMVAVDLPAPLLNAAVHGASGRRYFGDFVWPGHRVIGESDGVGKYGRTAAEIRAALRAERERQADLEAAGWRLVRWVTGDAGAQIVGRVSRALYLGPAAGDGVLGLGA
jgi:hypothetical protein